MEEQTPKEGYLIDYISGKEVKATPEEVNAVQVFFQDSGRGLQISKG